MKAASAGGGLQHPELATRAKAEGEEGAAEAGVVGAGEKAPVPKLRMSKRDIHAILTKKPFGPWPRFDKLKLRNPDLTPRPEEEGDEDKVREYFLARMHFEDEENLVKKKEWVRRELKTKGYVEVDDEWFKNKAENKAASEEALKGMKEVLLEVLPDADVRDFGFDDDGRDDGSDSDDDDESDFDDEDGASVSGDDGNDNSDHDDSDDDDDDDDDDDEDCDEDDIDDSGLEEEKENNEQGTWQH